MKFRLRYILLTLVLSGAVSVVFLLSRQKEAQISQQQEGGEQVQRLLELSSIAFEQMSERMATELTRVIEAELLVQDKNSSWLKGSAYDSIALLKPGQEGLWQLDWLKTGESTATSFDIRNWLNSLKPGDLNRTETLFQVANTEAATKIIIGIQLKLNTKDGVVDRYGIGLLSRIELAGLMSELKAGSAEIFYVDQNGFAISFPDPQYLGSQMDVHPIVSVSLKSNSMQTVGPFSDLYQNRTVGGYKKSSNTGVTTIVNLPQSLSAVQKQSFVFLMVLVFGLTALAIVFVLFFTGSDLKTIQGLKTQLAKLHQQLIELRNQSRNLDMARQAHLHWSRSVSGYLRSPVYSLIGELQKVKPSRGEADRNFEFIESELRKMKDFIEGLGNHAEDTEGLQTFNMKTRLEELFLQYSDKYNQRGFLLTTSDVPEVYIYGNITDFHSAIDLLLEFFLKELAAQKTSKNLVIDVKQVYGTISISFEAEVSDMPETLDEVMSLQNDRFIQLAIANGLFKALSANTRIENGLEKFKYLVSLPVSEKPKIESVATSAKASEEAKSPMASQLISEDKKEKVELLAKKVSDELDRVLPPVPDPSEDVSVVEELTASEANIVKKNEAPKVNIRKPRVRLDS